jgi:amino acid transporter
VSGPVNVLLRRKPIETIEEEPSGLQRTLGLWQLTAIGIGGIIGAGIFSLAGVVANQEAGPGVVISFLVAGVASAAAAFSYAEFAGLIPRAGSAYTYGYVVLGEFAAWFIGWDLLLEYTAIVSVVAIGISGYLGELLGFLGVSLPAWMLGAPGTEPEGVAPGTYVVDLLAVLLCLLIAFVLTRGMRSAARFETSLVYLKVAVVLLPAWFSKTHPVHKVPTRTTWILGVAAAVLAGFLPIEAAADLTNIGILLAFVVVCIAVIVLRYRRPDLPRSFRCPWMPVVPAVGVAFSIWLIVLLGPATWLRFAAWFVLGLAIYFFYSRRKSLLAQR